MGPSEWIALVAVALSAVIPTLAAWRSSLIQGQRIEAKLDALGRRLDALEQRADRQDEQLAEEREERHRLELRIGRPA